MFKKKTFDRLTASAVLTAVILYKIVRRRRVYFKQNEPINGYIIRTLTRRKCLNIINILIGY